jgi:hypothetical protein
LRQKNLEGLFWSNDIFATKTRGGWIEGIEADKQRSSGPVFAFSRKHFLTRQPETHQPETHQPFSIFAPFLPTANALLQTNTYG